MGDDVRVTALADAVSGMVQEVAGPRRRVSRMTRIRGGTKKGVYRNALDDGSSLVTYVWDAAHDQWATPGHDRPDDPDPLTGASGLDLFRAAHRRLTSIPVRVPAIHAVDDSHRSYPGDLALVEDVDGRSLETHLAEDRRDPGTILDRLAESLRRMHGTSGADFGRVRLVDQGHSSVAESCHRLVLPRALRDVDSAAIRDSRIDAVRQDLRARLSVLAEGIEPRQCYSLIHGELGPDHIMIDRNGQPVLIDIENLMYFDVEWEHAFLRIRFGPHYPRLDPGLLDRRRVDLYALATRISLVAGPLRLLENGCADHGGMRQIAEHNIRETLELCR